MNMWGLYEVITNKTTETQCTTSETLIDADFDIYFLANRANRWFAKPSNVKGPDSVQLTIPHVADQPSNSWKSEGQYRGGGHKYSIEGYCVIRKLPTLI